MCLKTILLKPNEFYFHESDFRKNDEFCEITLRGGDKATGYDFGELRLAEISGYVHLDPNENCVFDTSEGDEPIAGVTLHLMNDAGEIVSIRLVGSTSSG